MLFPLALPPGIYRNGTEYQAKGRWFDCNLVRFFEGTIRPHGGWRKHSLSAITGKGRALLAWADNSTVTRAAIGSESHLYLMGRDGTLYDITPSGFTPGHADATVGGGYGLGTYGTSTYGTPRPDTSLVQDASVWTLDTFGEDLVGCMADDGKIYQWVPPTTGAVATQVSGSPTARAIVVTEEGFLVALGAESVSRRAKWCDQRDDTTWTPSATNQAGDYDLETYGKLMCGTRVRGATLLHTDIDVHRMHYTADTLVYGFEKLSDHCGIISQNGGVSVGDGAMWMGHNGFWSYNGYVNPLPCDVSDYVFSDINTQQSSKVSCVNNTPFGEVTWYYPSSSSNENDHYVTHNYREQHWTIGAITRFAGVDKGVFQYPLRIASDGYVYDHECGFTYTDGATTYIPYIESGPVEVGNGDTVMYATQLIPDEKTQGDVTATFKTKFYPNGSESSFGPYSLGSSTDVRFAGRSARLRYDGAMLDDWRVGTPRLDLVAGGGR